MYYVKTENSEYDITTSYATVEEAKRFGATQIASGERHLMSEGGGGEFASIMEYDGEPGELSDYGRVRTHVVNKYSGNEGKFCLLAKFNSGSSWEFTGVRFQSCGDANKAIKSGIYKTCAELLVVEEGDTCFSELSPSDCE